MSTTKRGVLPADGELFSAGSTPSAFPDGRHPRHPLPSMESAPVAKESVRDALDHPVFFSLVLALTTVGWLAVLTWLSKAAGLPGPSALFQHP